MRRYQSWGRYPKVQHALSVPVFWRNEPPRFEGLPYPVLPFAQGRSYGDSCLNEGGGLINTSSLRRFMAFDKERGILCCEAGTTLADILELVVPCGWFLPVTPGTKYVSVGGAIANDVHGKNHHRAGTFGCYVRQFELLRSSGERFLCSLAQNPELFRATIGGLGLTGLILWAELQLKPIASPLMTVERIGFAHLEDFFALSAISDTHYEYTVAWVDSLAHGKNLGRGIFIRGNHTELALKKLAGAKKARPVQLCFDAPAFLLNRLTMRAFNAVYYHSQRRKKVQNVFHYETFFYPLDAIHGWNRLYGARGFLQYQCVLPHAQAYEVLREMVTRVACSDLASCLGVLKVFGPVTSPGMLSFPRPGVTFAIDFPHQGRRTLQLLEELDDIVRTYHGAVYPAKDARMSARSFQTYFPQWAEFARLIDPKFSSSFWRRVTIPFDAD
jgi:FAD/FMN-containing dehydrogenase